MEVHYTILYFCVCLKIFIRKNFQKALLGSLQAFWEFFFGVSRILFLTPFSPHSVGDV